MFIEAMSGGRSCKLFFLLYRSHGMSNLSASRVNYDTMLILRGFVPSSRPNSEPLDGVL